jgi:hypothetical protein
MYNMLHLRWMPSGLRKRAVPLAFVVGAGFCLTAMSTTCLAQQSDHSAATKSIGEQEADLSRAKLEEIGLQFVLVVILGSALTFVMSELRDFKTRKESNLASLRDLIVRVDDLYRSTKQTKRMIRSRLEKIDDGYEIDAVFFAARMDELSNAQLKLEQIRNAIRTRIELFDGERKKRILKEIEYCETYLHEVVQEFEARQVSWSGACCGISKSCKMLMNFLGEIKLPEDVEDDFKIMRDAPASVDRFRALESIIRKTTKPKSDCERHKRISDGCMLLVIREMRDIVLERQGRLSPARLATGSQNGDVYLDRPTPASSPEA